MVADGTLPEFYYLDVPMVDMAVGDELCSNGTFPSDLPSKPITIDQARTRLRRWKNVLKIQVDSVSEQDGQERIDSMSVLTKVFGEMEAQWREQAWQVEKLPGPSGLHIECPKCGSVEYYPVKNDDSMGQCTSCCFEFTVRELIDLAERI